MAKIEFERRGIIDYDWVTVVEGLLWNRILGIGLVMKTKKLLLVLILLPGCRWIPEIHSAPKSVTIDGYTHVACTGFVLVYTPSRNVRSSSQLTYEITFTDNYGKSQDFKNISSYVIKEIDNATFATPYPMPGPDMVKYSNGAPITPRSVVLFGTNGDAGRALYLGDGKWAPAICE